MTQLPVGSTYTFYRLQDIRYGGLVSDGWSSHQTEETLNIGMAYGFRRFPEIEGFLVTPINRTKTPFGQDDIIEEQEPIIYFRNQD